MKIVSMLGNVYEGLKLDIGKLDFARMVEDVITVIPYSDSDNVLADTLTDEVCETYDMLPLTAEEWEHQETTFEFWINDLEDNYQLAIWITSTLVEERECFICDVILSQNEQQRLHRSLNRDSRNWEEENICSMTIDRKEEKHKPTANDLKETKQILNDFLINCKIPVFQTVRDLLKWQKGMIQNRLARY